MRSQTFSTVIRQSFDDVYSFLADPGNFPSWGPVTDPNIHYVHGGDWLIHTHCGPQIMRFSAPNLHGVLDCHLFGAGEPPGPPMPVRLVAWDPHCELLVTWRQRSNVNDVRYAGELQTVEATLGRLKALLEAEPAD